MGTKDMKTALLSILLVASLATAASAASAKHVRQHHVAHPHGVHIGLQQQALILHVRADQHKSADHNQPHIRYQKTHDH